MGEEESCGLQYSNSGIVADQNSERILKEAQEKAHVLTDSTRPKSSKEKNISLVSKVKAINLR